MGTIFFCGDKALKAHTPGGVCAAHPGGLCVVGYTWLRPLASTAFSFSGFFSFFGSLFLGCQSSVHGTFPMCDRYSYELLFQLVPVGHSLLFLLPGLSTTRCCECLRRFFVGCVRFCSGGASAHFPPPLRVVLGPGLDLPPSAILGESPAIQ